MLRALNFLLVIGLFWMFVNCKSPRCKSKKNAEQTKEPSSQLTAHSNSVISLEKTACFGKCPIYTISLMGNGNLSFFGKRFTEKSGAYSKQVDSSFAQRLLKQVYDLDFKSYDAEYRTGYTDMPSHILKYKAFDGRSLDLRTEANGPDEIEAIVTSLDSLRLSKGWQALEVD